MEFYSFFAGPIMSSLAFFSQLFPCEAQTHLGCIDKILNDINMCMCVQERDFIRTHLHTYLHYISLNAYVLPTISHNYVQFYNTLPLYLL